ncbi:MAG: hypothetical protein R3E12_13140 [Candidatus Eisenbacteria bacterium]
MSRLGGRSGGSTAGASVHEEETLDQVKIDRQLLRRLAVFIRPYTRRVVIAIAILLVSSVIDLVFPLLIKRGIDDCIRRAACTSSSSSR